MLLQLSYRVIPLPAALVPSMRLHARIGAAKLIDHVRRLRNAGLRPLAVSRRTALFAVTDGKTLTDIGVHPSQIAAALHLGTKGIPANDDHGDA